MTDLTTPGETGAGALSTASGHAWDKGPGPWIVPTVDIADDYTSLDETQLDGFRHSTTTGLDVTIAAGEAYLAGWLCRDRTTTVTLPGSATTTIYVGYDSSAVLSSGQAPADNENVIIGPAGSFSDNDPRTPLYEFTTDGTTVTASTDLRKLEQPVDFDPVADRVNVTSELAMQGDRVATEAYVDNNRYTDSEARSAVIAEILPAGSVWMGAPSDAGGHPYGFRCGADGLTNYSFYNGDTTIYSMHTGGGFRFRNAYVGSSGLDMFTVDNETGDAWLRGGLDSEGLLDNRNGDGIAPKTLGSTESLPTDTVPGRMVYDPSREQ